VKIVVPERLLNRAEVDYFYPNGPRLSKVAKGKRIAHCVLERIVLFGSTRH
jgi:hypothetical protein